LIERIALFVVNRSSEFTIRINHELAAGLEASITQAPLPQILQFLIKGGLSVKNSEEQSLKRVAPTPADMSEYCGIIADTLIQTGLMDHIFFLIDDVDLIEGYTNATQNGRMQRSLLADCLATLHSVPGVDILLTARSWYAHSHRDFQQLLELEGMTATELSAIYELQARHFGGQVLKKPFLLPEALQRVAEDSGGRPGVFLQRLRTAFEQYQKDDSWESRDYEWYFDVFRRLYARHREKNPRAGDAIEAAIRAEKYTIDVRDGNPFYNTPFDQEFVFQSYYNEAAYDIDALTFNVARDYLKSHSKAAGA
jgi:hypothetical protein